MLKPDRQHYTASNISSLKESTVSVDFIKPNYRYNMCQHTWPYLHHMSDQLTTSVY